MAKTTRVGMPQLGESVDEGTISKWRVKPGDKVIEFEPMLEVDTDKVNAEVPAPVAGILREILAKEGETVQAGAEIAVVELSTDGKAVSSPPRGAISESEPTRAGAQGQGEGLKPVPAPPPSPGQDEGLKSTSPSTPPPSPTLGTAEHPYSPPVPLQPSGL